MGVQDIKKIETDDFYIDLAFRKATEKSDKMRSKTISRDNTLKSKQLESCKVNTVKEVLDKRLSAILRGFPDLDDLHEFYREMIKTVLDWRTLKKSLGAVNWADQKIVTFGVETNRKINRSMHGSTMNKLRREYYGRCASFLKQIRRNLLYLENARKTMRTFPNVKTGIPTIAIVGFPNVGKTTLLYKLTGARAEIDAYAFTTKGVNVGYITKKQKNVIKRKYAATPQEAALSRRSKIQLLDTPGTLNRPDKMNAIEKIAYLALNLLADKAIYVFDLTEPFPLEDQIRLHNEVKKLGLPLLTYISKTDLMGPEVYQEFAKQVGAITSLDKIKEFLN